MKIAYKEKYSSNELERKTTLAALVSDAAEDYERGELETMAKRAEISIQFTSSLIECLHKKGILSEQEVEEIIKPFSSIRSGSFKIIPNG